MSETSYHIKYKKADLEIEVQGDKTWVEDKFKELLKESSSNFSPNPQTGSPSGNIAFSGSLVEFLISKGNPVGLRDKVLVFAYWLFKKKGMNSYNISDIENCFEETRNSKPANTTDNMNKLQAQGLIMPTEEKDGKKAWVITATGEKEVEQMKA